MEVERSWSVTDRGLNPFLDGIRYVVQEEISIHRLFRGVIRTICYCRSKTDADQIALALTELHAREVLHRKSSEYSDAEDHADWNGA